MPGCSGPTATACPSSVTYGRSSSSSLSSSTASRLALRFSNIRMPELALRPRGLHSGTSSSVSSTSTGTGRYYSNLAARPTSRTSYDVHLSPSSDWSYSSTSFDLRERRYSSASSRSGRHSSITEDTDIVPTRYGALSTRDRYEPRDRDSGTGTLSSTSTTRSTRDRFESRERDSGGGGGLSTTSSVRSTPSRYSTDSYSRAKSGSVDYGRSARAISHDDTKATGASNNTSPSTISARSRAASTVASLSSTAGERPPINSRFLKKVKSEREAANAADKPSEDADTANNNTNNAVVNGLSNDDNGNPERRSSVANLCRQFDPSPVTRSSKTPSVEKDLKKEDSPVPVDTPASAAVTPVPVAERNGTAGPLAGGCAPPEADKLLVNGTARLSRVSAQRASSPAQSSDSDIYDSPRVVRRALSHGTSGSGSGSARSGGLNGLRNIGNTCFMNSVIQCLSNTRPLLEYLQKQNYTSEINTTNSSMKGALIEAFAKMIKELWTGEDNVVDTTAFKRQIQHFAPRFMGYSQQDAQEFLRYLLEGLHEDVNRVETRPRTLLPDIDDALSDNQKAEESWRRYLRLDDSAVVDIFVGQLKSTLRCTSCGHASVTFDPFWDLSLPLPSRTQLRLTQCLEHFTREEVLDGDEKPTCAKCKTRKKCTKSFSIQKFPKILVLHLKRFSPTERFRGKLNVQVEFPLTGLDLSEYAANRDRASCTYNLYGVANHSGTTYSGHYTAYCKHPYSGDWHEYDDSKVSTISSRSIVSSEGYVLFYELASQSSHL